MHLFKGFNKFIAIVMLVLLVQISCTTEDILPTIELSATNTNVSEDNGTITLTATLNTTVSESVIIPLNISGNATTISDYIVSASEIVIASGTNSGSITITGVQDQDIEGIEKIILTLTDSNSFLIISEPSIEISILDDDADTDGDGVLDSNDNCPTVVGDPSNNGCPFLGFLINEVLYDPASDSTGDANGDGNRDANEDEFIEFFNSGPALDISGYTVSDADRVRHTFPSGTIIPINGVLVLFGGGTPAGNFGGAIVQVASEGLLNMNNNGDVVTLRNLNGDEVLTFDINNLSANPNESYSRNPDLTGAFEQHAGIPAANGALFSPGTKVDGTPFN